MNTFAAQVVARLTETDEEDEARNIITGDYHPMASFTLQNLRMALRPFCRRQGYRISSLYQRKTDRSLNATLVPSGSGSGRRDSYSTLSGLYSALHDLLSDMLFEHDLRNGVHVAVWPGCEVEMPRGSFYLTMRRLSPDDTSYIQIQS